MFEFKCITFVITKIELNWALCKKSVIWFSTWNYPCKLWSQLVWRIKRTGSSRPSSIYSLSIGHILEHEFFCLGHLGCAGSKGKKWIWVFLSNFWGWFFQLFEGKKMFKFFLKNIRLESKSRKGLSLKVNFLPMRALKFITGHVTIKLHYDQTYQTKPP